jgi:hypothetical protein
VASERTVHLFEVQHRRAEELLPFAQAGLGERGRAVVDARSNTLLLTGSRAAVSETVALLRMQDRLPRTVLLDHRSERVSQLAARGVDIAWSVAAGPVRVGNVVWPHTPAALAVHAHDAAARKTSSRRGHVRVLEGSTAELLVGTTVAVPVRDGRRRGTALVTAPSGFRATPRVLGDGRVEVELAPIRAEVDARGEVAWRAASTTVIASPGETLAIAGVDAQTASGALGAGASRADAADTEVLLLTVDLEPAPEPGNGGVQPVPADSGGTLDP